LLLALGTVSTIFHNQSSSLIKFRAFGNCGSRNGSAPGSDSDLGQNTDLINYSDTSDGFSVLTFQTLVPEPTHF